MNTLRRRTLLAGLPALLAGPAAWSQAAFPSRAITLVVPFAAGGGTDLVARVIAQHMEGQLGHPVLVDNKAGANGNIAGAFVAKAPADGHTVLYNTSSMVISPAVYRNLGFEALKELAPVGLSASIPTGMLVAPQLPVRTLQEFVAYAKANSGKLAYGSSGAGNINHMTALQFTQALGIDAIHAPYKGSAPATIDLSAGRIHFMIDTVSNVAGFVKEGKLKLLATATPRRLSMYADVPTFTESGVPNFESGAWSGMMVPVGTPRAVIDRLNGALLAALRSPQVRAKLDEQGTVVLGSSPEEYAAFLRAEAERWAQVARKAKLEPQ
jgi:tripartite-type tricarboxylate transporter receptor subunit TctC